MNWTKAEALDACSFNMNVDAGIYITFTHHCGRAMSVGGLPVAGRVNFSP
jgi:hypothetical protein